MAKETTTIKIEPDSELAHALAETDTRTVVLESEGVRFTVKRCDEGPWANYDPEKVEAGLK